MSEIDSPQISMDRSIRQIQRMFNREMGDCLMPPSEELVGISKDDANTRTLYVFTEKLVRHWLFFKKKTPPMRRNILRITHVVIPKQFSMFNQGILRCELFLSDPRLRNIVQIALDPLKYEVWFVDGIEYVDMSHDPLAFYPDERVELPKAQLLNR